MTDGPGRNPETPVGSHDPNKPHMATRPGLVKPIRSARAKPPFISPELRAWIDAVRKRTVEQNREKVAAAAAAKGEPDTSEK